MNFLKFDLIRNKRYFRNVSILFALLIVLGLVLEFALINFLSIDSILSYKMVFDVILIIFAFAIVSFAIGLIRKDLFTSSSTIVFSLPMGRSKYFTSKLLLLVLVYIYNLIFSLILLKLLNYQITSDLLYYFFLGLIWFLIFFAISFYGQARNRFTNKNHGNTIIILMIGLILILGFFICKNYSLVLVESGIQHALPMNYAFIYPFAIGNLGIYKNITTLIYYIIVLIGMWTLNTGNLEENLDL